MSEKSDSKYRHVAPLNAIIKSCIRWPVYKREPYESAINMTIYSFNQSYYF